MKKTKQKKQKTKMVLSFNVMTFNCCLAVRPPLRFNGAYERSRRLVDAVYSCVAASELDVICFQELIAFREFVLNEFTHFKKHTFATKPIYSSLVGNNIRFLHSGLAIVSKWPILEEDAYVFEGQSYNAEAFMAKAVQYCKLLVNDTHIVHVFNTHLQAWTNPLATSIRRNQMEQISVFMRKKLAQSSATQLPFEPVIFTSDLNVDVYENWDMVEQLLAQINAHVVLPSTPQFSFDPTNENPLVGIDDMTEYAKRTPPMTNKNKKIPDFSTPFDKDAAAAAARARSTPSSHLPPKQLVDCVMLLTSQRNNLLQAVSNVVPILSPALFQIKINISTHKTIQNISDHAAVYCNLQFITQQNTIKLKPTYKNSYSAQWHLGWIIAEIAIFTACVFLLLFFLRLLVRFKLKTTTHQSPSMIV
jgi:endonuclease/exonuclease/phosphatase family metal-dependent hydrolase